MNLLKDLAIKIKLAKLDDERIKHDLKYLKQFIINIYKDKLEQLKNEKKKEKYIAQYLPTEKEYREIIGLYYFAQKESSLTEKEFSAKLKQYWRHDFRYIKQIRMYITNVLDKIILNGPFDIVKEYILEINRIEKVREQALQTMPNSLYEL